jgi:hypothetical protein
VTSLCFDYVLFSDLEVKEEMTSSSTDTASEIVPVLALNEVSQGFSNWPCPCLCVASPPEGCVYTVCQYNW